MYLKPLIILVGIFIIIKIYIFFEIGDLIKAFLLLIKEMYE